VIAPEAASASRIWLHRLAVAGVVLIVAFIVGGFAAWYLFPALSTPSSRLVGWRVGYGFGSHEVVADAAQTTTVISVEATWTICAPADPSWIAPPMITYTPLAVIITLKTTDEFGDRNKCLQSGPHGPMEGNYLSGLYFPVQLSERLGGRALFDGSVFPPVARPFR
jgi:hypothetical protein